MQKERIVLYTLAGIIVVGLLVALSMIGDINTSLDTLTM